MNLMTPKYRIGIAVILLAALISGCSLADAMQAIPWLNPTITSSPTASLTPTSTRTLVTFNRWTNTPESNITVLPEAIDDRSTWTPIPTNTLRPSWTPEPTETLRPTRTTTYTITPSITPSPTNTPEVVRFINETFSSPNAMWYQAYGSNWRTYFHATKDVFAMKVIEPNVEITVSHSILILNEVRIEADISTNRGSGYYGFNCRESESNYYTLFITTDGHYGLGQTLNGKVEFIYYAASPAIDPTPGVYNHVRAECRGNTLTLWANGVLLVQKEIESLAAGYTGMMTGTRWDDDNVVAHFDNLQVWGPITTSATPTP